MFKKINLQIRKEGFNEVASMAWMLVRRVFQHVWETQIPFDEQLRRRTCAPILREALNETQTKPTKSNSTHSNFVNHINMNIHWSQEYMNEVPFQYRVETSIQWSNDWIDDHRYKRTKLELIAVWKAKHIRTYFHNCWLLMGHLGIVLFLD